MRASLTSAGAGVVGVAGAAVVGPGVVGRGAGAAVAGGVVVVAGGRGAVVEGAAVAGGVVVGLGAAVGGTGAFADAARAAKVSPPPRMAAEISFEANDISTLRLEG
jgi:hypothetical protein